MINKENKVFTLLVLSLIFGFFILLVGGWASSLPFFVVSGTEPEGSAVFTIDWEELYPYDTTVEEVRRKFPDSSEKSFASKLMDKLSNYGVLANKWSKSIYGYSSIAKLGYVISSRLSDPSVGISYVRCRNGSWIIPASEISHKKADSMAAPYGTLNRYLNCHRISFVYFYAPNKECTVDEEYPEGVVSCTNINIDKYLDALRSYGIDCVDLRRVLHAENLDHYSAFYKTDHHWTVESGLWASSVIVKKISEKLGMTMFDPVSLGEYRNITYPNAEFGSIANAVTRYVAEPEDFTVPYPAFETEYRVEIPNMGIDITGPFEDVFVDRKGLEELSENGGGGAYTKILYDNVAWQKVTNLKNPEGPKVIIIRDSFCRVVTPYLAGSFSELVEIRLGSENFNGSIIKCINQFRPDIVIVLQYEPLKLTINKK